MMDSLHPIRPKKSLGQNFLKDPHYLEKIIVAARISGDDRVLEIGPGLGHLTRMIAARAGTVLALELDDRLIPALRAEFSASPHVEIVHADALTFSYAALAGKWKVVANLPYYISTPLIQRLLEHRAAFTSLTLMLQKEVADRITASPGGKDYGYLSVVVQLYAEPRWEFLVPPGAFTPQPGVDSVVVTMNMRQAAPPVRDLPFLIRVIKAAFSQRRKTLRNALKPLGIPGVIIDATLPATGIDLKRRAETLRVAEFCALADHLSLLSVQDSEKQ